MPHDPAHIRGRPEHIAHAAVIDGAHRPVQRDQMACGGADDALGLARGAAGVQHVTAAALVVTALNTVVMYLDSVIQGYYSYAYVFGGLTLRVISGIATAVIMSFVAPPVVKLLERTMAQVKK